MWNDWRGRLVRFLLRPESDQWLAWLRIGLGLEVAFYCVSLRADWKYLFASHGLISRDLTEAILLRDSIMTPRLSWFTNLGGYAGLGEETTNLILWICLLGAGLLLVTGLFSRTAAVVAWLLHLGAVKSIGFMTYGVDNFTTIGLFYLMVAPLPDRYSLDYRLRKLPAKDSRRQGAHRHVLQLHLCLVYFFGGLSKCLGSDWWNGSSMWRALIRPPFDTLAPATVVSWGYLLPLVGISVCLIEISYPFLIWSRKTRVIWLALALTMHIGIGLTMGLYLFSLIMIVLNLAAFAPDLPGGLLQHLPSPEEGPVVLTRPVAALRE
jgi:hypothetical protein